MNAILRLADETDLAQLARLHTATFAQGWDERALQGLMQAGAVATLAEQEGKVAGFILARNVKDEAEILTIAVVPKARRAGIGGALVTEAARLATLAGAVRLFLEVGQANMAARTLYRGLAFAQVGSRKGYYRFPGKDPEDALILAVRLPLSGLGNSSCVD